MNTDFHRFLLWAFFLNVNCCRLLKTKQNKTRQQNKTRKFCNCHETSYCHGHFCNTCIMHIALCLCLPDTCITVSATVLPFARWRVFPVTPCGAADVLMCSVSMKWLSSPHWTVATRPCTVSYMSALPKSSSLCFHSVFSNSEMIFIPLGMLDKFSLSPLTPHIWGRVSCTPLLTSNLNIYNISYVYRCSFTGVATFVWESSRSSIIITHASEMLFVVVKETAVDL